MRVRHRLLLLGVLAIFAAGPAAAAPPSPSPADGALEETDWFDPDRNELVPVEVEPASDDSAHRDSRWVAQPETKTKQSGSTTGGGSFQLFGLSLGHLLGWTVLAVMLVAVVSLLVYAFMKADIDLGAAGPTRGARDPSRAPDEQTQQRIEQLPAELGRSTALDWRSEAERLMREGHLERAVVYLFGHQLLLLDRAGILRLSRGKTNGRYVREARREDAPAAEHLQATVTLFERSYFGRHGITGEEFAALWQRNEQLEQRVASRREVAA